MTAAELRSGEGRLSCAVSRHGRGCSVGRLGGEDCEVILKWLALAVAVRNFAGEKLLVSARWGADNAVDVLVDAQSEFADKVGPLVSFSKLAKGIVL